mmetsp:Transcript_98994/g.263003  ORF Transcript_98994/g.263003 Transcript_98994/m.263003 type:complete len:326 (+) Transcript_98994:1260-2237(+)
MIKRGEVFGGLPDSDAGQQTDRNAHEDAHRLLLSKKRGADHSGHDNEGSPCSVEALLHGPHQAPEVHVPALAFLLCGDKRIATHGANGAGSRQEEWKCDLGRVFAAERGGCQDGTDVGLEEVGTHAGDVTDVVSNIVGYDRRVVRVILVNVGLHLANEIRRHICCLRVDAPRNAREEGGSRGAKAEATQQLQGASIAAHRDRAEHHEAERESSQSKGDYDKAHDGASSEGNLKAAVEAPHCTRHGSPDVRVSGDQHAHPARKCAERSASNEGGRDQGPVEGSNCWMDSEEHAQHSREAQHEPRHLGVLLLQEGHCSRLDLCSKVI